MDPVTQTIILGLLTNGISSIGQYSLIKCNKYVKRDVPINLEEPDISKLLNKPIKSIIKNINLDSLEKEKINSFFESPEAESIIRQIYSNIITESDNLNLLKQEFLASFSLFIDKNDEIDDVIKGKLFDLLVEACNKSIEIATKENIIPTHEFKSKIRHQKLIGEIENINKNLEFLTSNNNIDIGEILEFEKDYRAKVKEREKYILPPNFYGSRKVNIDKIYVNPNFKKIQKDKEPLILNTKNFLSSIHRVVILGNPGGGKSTFSLKMCQELTKNYLDKPFARRSVTPILVVLRDYGAKKKENSISIIDFIEMTANSTYMANPPEGAFEYLLLNGRVMVIFDGLDELLDTSYRQQITSDIELFCSLYPSVPVVVTSREVGYEQAPLNKDQFEIYLLTDFNEAQVKEYVTKWFISDEDSDSDEIKVKTSSFIKESRNVSDLRSNPLMLALMCNLYKGANYIPRNRPDVYEKCATMLFERWDKSRDIISPLPFEAHVKPALMHLANWIYSNESLQSGVTETKLISKTADYLHEKRYEDEYEAEKAAADFVEFCRGRAWVFTDMGTTKYGETLYQFTHRTFLEFFTAAYIVRKNHDPQKLLKFLLPKIAKREWDTVTQLAFQRLNKNVDNAGDDLLFELIQRSKTSEDKWNLLSFAVRCLEFIIPSPLITRTITNEYIESYIDLGLSQINSKKFTKNSSFQENQSISAILGYLLNADAENMNVILKNLEKTLTKHICGNDLLKSSLSIELIFHLEIPFLFAERLDMNNDAKNLKYKLESVISSLNSEKIKLLCSNYYPICNKFYYENKISIEEIIEIHGLEAIFKSCEYAMFSEVSFSALAPTIIRMSCDGINSKLEITLEKIGLAFISSPKPFIDTTNEVFDIIHWNNYPKNPDKTSTTSLNHDSIFGLFCLTAVYLEICTTKKDSSKCMISVKKHITPLLKFKSIFEARFMNIEPDKVIKEIDTYNFNLQQKEFILKWVKKEINLVKTKSN